MNIIVSQDKSIRLTQYSNQSTYNLDDIYFYFSKELDATDSYVRLTPESSRTNYDIPLIQCGEAKNYLIYKISPYINIKLSNRPYYFSILMTASDLRPVLIADMITIFAINQYAETMSTLSLRKNVALEDYNPYGLIDDEEPIEISDDRIIMMRKSKNTIMAEDNVSEILTFRVKQYQDNIDLNSKAIYFDYIALDDEKQEIKSLPIYSRAIETMTVGNTQTPYLLLRFAVPYILTKQSGEIHFAISAIDEGLNSGDENYEEPAMYVWQTQPAKLTILSNLGKRPFTPITPENETPSLTPVLERLGAAEQDIVAIKGSDIYELDENPTDDEIILSGGGAPV